jgi:hypothetical protein
MKILKIAALSAATIMISAGSASAYTMDADGYGFVGKGEVQTPFGWNNSTLQRYATEVTFTYEESTTYNAVCSWVTGEGTRGEKAHDVTHKRSTEVEANVDADPRKTKGQQQFTGFILKGFGESTSSGVVPIVGEACMGNEGHGGTWSDVTETGSTPGGLYAHHVNTDKHALLVEAVPVA